MSEAVTIVFQTPDGNQVSVSASPGTSVMEAAIMNNVSGIEAECGGSCICATCHVYCDRVAEGLLQAPDDQEDEMLDMTAAERRPSSRLSCQIKLRPELQNSVFLLPERQY